MATHVASELMRPSPVPAVSAWIAGRDADEWYLSAVSEAELWYGVAIVPAGRRRNALEAALLRWLDTGFAERILPFGSAAARAYADLAARRRAAGRPSAPAADRRIAAIARSRGLAVAPRTVRDFEDTGIEVVDPRTTG